MQEMSDATARWARGTGAEFFGTLNVLVEASVRAGCASPGLLPTGMVLLETTGAKSGLPRRVPLLATVLEGCLFIGTACGARSQWLRNLRAEPRVRYWLAGPRAWRRCPRLRRGRAPTRDSDASTSGPRRRRGLAAGCDGLWLAVRGHQPRTRGVWFGPRSRFRSSRLTSDFPAARSWHSPILPHEHHDMMCSLVRDVRPWRAPWVGLGVSPEGHPRTHCPYARLIKQKQYSSALPSASRCR